LAVLRDWDGLQATTFNDMAELEQIVDAHGAMVRRIAKVYERDRTKVDELAQEIWIAVWQALPRLNNPATLKGYVARIAQNICVTHVRRALIRRTVPLEDTVPDPAATPDETAAQAIDLGRLLEAVRCLPENLKAVATLYLEDLSTQEIAQSLGITEVNVAVRLHRAKAAMRLSCGDPS
jgi:RNA polymerase sigma factor (sigma-70 family)